MRFLVGNHEPCIFCGETPRDGAWGKPCPDEPKGLHWTRDQFRDDFTEKLASVGASLRRAAFELDKAASSAESLSPRLARKVMGAAPDLDPLLLRNEAERARDTLHVFGLLDV